MGTSVETELPHAKQGEMVVDVVEECAKQSSNDADDKKWSDFPDIVFDIVKSPEVGQSRPGQIPGVVVESAENKAQCKG